MTRHAKRLGFLLFKHSFHPVRQSKEAQEYVDLLQYPIVPKPSIRLLLHIIVNRGLKFDNWPIGENNGQKYAFDRGLLDHYFCNQFWEAMIIILILK